MKISILLVIALIAGCSSISSTNSPFTISGIVVTEEGKPVPNAPVMLYDDTTSYPLAFKRSDIKLAETKSNSDGKFVLSVDAPIPKGHIKVVALSKKRTVEVSPREFKVYYDDGVVKNPDIGKSVKIVVPKHYSPAK